MESFDINQIMEMLPHRYPFILVDRILEHVPSKRIKALKNVTINEPFFQGHFPQAPVMPGVLIIEAMAQAGGVMALLSLPPELRDGVVYFMGIDKARFRKPVVPGDQLVFELDMVQKRGTVVKVAGKAFVDGDLVAEASLMASVGEQT